LSLAAPRRGDVIRYGYLWADEQAAGSEEGRKDRPAIVLALSVALSQNATRVLVVAVTHTAPDDPADAVLFPAGVKRSIGLDEGPAWIVTTEGNAFDRPGPDIRPVPGRHPRTICYGRIPERLLRKIAVSYLANRERQRARLVQRSV
jgi:hypothetical protein